MLDQATHPDDRNSMEPLTVGSLFSGIGGIDLGCERAGMRVAWQSEIDSYACRVLSKHWPDIPNLGDITTVDWDTVPTVDVICGGYPCQPFSLAGSRQGTEDARHLWPHFAHAISVLRPRYALLENVSGHLSLGFGDVLADLVSLGYDARWDCIPAAAVGAPHRRDRLFVVAYAQSERCEWPMSTGSSRTSGRVPEGCGSNVADTDSKRRSIGIIESARVIDGSDYAERTDAPVADPNGPSRSTAWSASETLFRPETLERFRRRSSSDGHTWTVEPDVGRVANGIPHRVDRLRALGNAVVPQVAQYVAEQIISHSKATRSIRHA